MGVARSSLKPPRLALLRCKVLGHLWGLSSVESPNKKRKTGYRVHTSCARCWKTKTLVNPATTISAKRLQE